LQSRQQVDEARAGLEARGLSCLRLEVPRHGFWNRLVGRKRTINLGDRLKSWDVLQTVDYLERQTRPSSAVLDLGAFNSEILPLLHRKGMTNLTGVDLNPDLGSHMPVADAIRYVVSDFMATGLPDAGFDAITAISVIEHGYQPERLFAEVARLLAPGGVFIATFDYWPEKIDTAGVEFFGLSWIIFSREDVQQMLAIAANHGLKPDGPISLEAGAERPVHCANRDYSFAWMSLRKG
jgi:SAM-dependent methyltransferase